VPFLALGLPLITLTILNAFFYYFSIVLLFKSLRELVSFNLTVILSFAWACYLVAYVGLVSIVTETFTYLLVTLLIYSIVKLFKQSKSNVKTKYLILAGFFLGYLVLTKMIFGYVILFLLGWNFLLWVWSRKSPAIKRD
jgi:4-amino-4-deoxy-L-arabinose transferase-like glycosyltransferase